MIAYFLRGGGNYSVGFVKEGNTELVAELIQKETNGHLFKIESEHFYPNNYDECTRVCKSGKNANARPKLKQNIKDLNEYDIVYLGYPIWWSDFPMVVYSFLENNDFSNKIIMPFCTHEGSGISSTVEHIKSICKNADVRDGYSQKGSIVGKNLAKAASEIKEWIKDNSL